MTIQRSRLTNGFTVVSEDMPGLESTALSVYVAAGSRHEAARHNGVAHFLEHMVFKGTPTRNAIQIAEAIEDVGGYLNACTSRETTAYLARMLPDDLPLAVEIIADIMTCSSLDTDELELERSVILHEIAEIDDSPEDSVFEALIRTAYPDQPYGRSISGTLDRVSALQRKDLTAFVDRHYCPSHMVLSAAGAVDHARLCRLAEHHFGALEQRPRPPAEPAQFRGGEMRDLRRDEQVQFAIAKPGPKLSDPDEATARVYAMILGGGASSRLFVEAREKRGLCYAISASAMPGTDTGSLILHAGTGESEIKQLSELCSSEMKRMADGVSDREVARAKANIRSGLVMGLESPANRAERMAMLLLFRGEIEPVEQTVARFDTVSIDCVRSYAERVLAQPPTAMAVRGAIDQAPSLPSIEACLA